MCNKHAGNFVMKDALANGGTAGRVPSSLEVLQYVSEAVIRQTSCSSFIDCSGDRCCEHVHTQARFDAKLGSGCIGTVVFIGSSFGMTIALATVAIVGDTQLEHTICTSVGALAASRSTLIALGFVSLMDHCKLALLVAYLDPSRLT